MARLALVIAVYLSLDVTNPMMPGAFVFGVDDSVELRQADRFRPQANAPRLAPAPVRDAPLEPPPIVATPARTPTPLRRAAHGPRSSLPLVPVVAPEDH
jgi:hypothetical protein